MAPLFWRWPWNPDRQDDRQARACLPDMNASPDPIAATGPARLACAAVLRRSQRAAVGLGVAVAAAGCASDIQYQQISAPQEPLMYELRTDSLKAVDGAARRLCPKGHQVLSTAESGQLKSRWLSLPETTDLVWIVRCEGDLATWRSHPRLQPPTPATPTRAALRSGAQPARAGQAASSAQAASAPASSASGPRIDEFGVIHF